MSIFRWHKGEHEQWIKKINRFNNKINNNKMYNYDLPDKINYKDKLKEILNDKNYSREEFNQQMKFIDNFLNKNALDLKKGERGARIPVWEFKNIKNNILPEINKKRNEQKKMLEEEEATDRGKKLGYKVREVEELATNKIKEKKFNWKHMSTPDFEKFKETLWEFNQTVEQRNKDMYDNYFKAINNEMTEGSNEAKTLLRIIKKLPQEVVIKKIYTDLNLGFPFVYTKTDVDIRFKTLKRAWNKIYKDYKKTLRSD